VYVLFSCLTLIQVLYFGTSYAYDELLFSRDYDGKVTPEEVASAAMYLKNTLGKEGVQELVSNLSKDKGMYLSSFKHLTSFKS